MQQLVAWVEMRKMMGRDYPHLNPPPPPHLLPQPIHTILRIKKALQKEAETRKMLQAKVTETEEKESMKGGTERRMQLAAQTTSTILQECQSLVTAMSYTHQPSEGTTGITE